MVELSVPILLVGCCTAKHGIGTRLDEKRSEAARVPYEEV